MNTDKKLIIAKINDLFSLCEKHCEAKFSPFLDGGEIAVIEDEVRAPYGFNTMLFGGYDGAERQMYGVFPEWEEAEAERFPIAAARFDAPKFRALTHRDYLGTLMSLGIDRNKTGDILTDEGGAYVMLDASVAEYVVTNMNKIANAGVKGRLLAAGDFTAPEPKTAVRECVAASMRLDAVIAAAHNVSRQTAERLIKEERVKVNHREAKNRASLLKEGDLVSVRGYGRFVLKEEGRETQKGRLHITVVKYI